VRFRWKNLHARTHARRTWCVYSWSIDKVDDDRRPERGLYWRRRTEQFPSDTSECDRDGWSGPIFYKYRSATSAYRQGIRRRQHCQTEIYTCDLHDALMCNHGVNFGKCRKSKAGPNDRDISNKPIDALSYLPLGHLGHAPSL